MIQNNSGTGVTLTGGSTASFGDTVEPLDTTVVRGNSVAGIFVTNGLVRLFGNTRVEGNGVFGVVASPGDVSFCCANGERQILNNPIGLRVRGGNVHSRSPLRIEGSSFRGLQLIAAQANLRDATLTNNGTAGIPAFSAIEVVGASRIALSQTDIVGNLGHGLLVQENSSAALSNATITGNGGDGVHLEVLSSANLSSGNDLSGNVQFDVFCDESSRAVGDLPSPSVMSCRPPRGR